MQDHRFGVAVRARVEGRDRVASPTEDFIELLVVSPIGTRSIGFRQQNNDSVGGLSCGGAQQGSALAISSRHLKYPHQQNVR